MNPFLVTLEVIGVAMIAVALGFMLHIAVKDRDRFTLAAFCFMVIVCLIGAGALIWEAVK